MNIAVLPVRLIASCSWPTRQFRSAGRFEVASV